MRKILLLSSLNVLLFACANQTNEEEVTSDSATYSSVAQETSSEEGQASYQSTV